MSDATSPTPEQPAPNPYVAQNPYVAPNPYVAQNPYAAQNPYVAANPYAAQNPATTPNPYAAPSPSAAPTTSASAHPYQPYPTVPAPSAPTPYRVGGAAYSYAPRTNPLAIASLVLSLAAFLTSISAIAGVITGHIALSQIKRTGEGGRGLAIAGLVIGYVASAFLLLWLLFAIAWIAIPSSGGGWL